MSIQIVALGELDLAVVAGFVGIEGSTTSAVGSIMPVGTLIGPGRTHDLRQPRR